jgi:hypothetical protein
MTEQLPQTFVLRAIRSSHYSLVVSLLVPVHPRPMVYTTIRVKFNANTVGLALLEMSTADEITDLIVDHSEILVKYFAKSPADIFS